MTLLSRTCRHHRAPLTVHGRLLPLQPREAWRHIHAIVKNAGTARALCKWPRALPPLPAVPARAASMMERMWKNERPLHCFKKQDDPQFIIVFMSHTQTFMWNGEGRGLDWLHHIAVNTSQRVRAPRVTLLCIVGYFLAPITSQQWSCGFLTDINWFYLQELYVL